MGTGQKTVTEISFYVILQCYIFCHALPPAADTRQYIIFVLLFAVYYYTRCWNIPLPECLQKLYAHKEYTHAHINTFNSALYLMPNPHRYSIFIRTHRPWS